MDPRDTQTEEVGEQKEDAFSGVVGNQTYGMQVAPWAESGMYIGSLAIYASGSHDEKVFNELAISHDGLAW